MANAIYPKWKEAVIQASANSSLSGTVKVALVDAGTYTYSAAHEFLSSLSGVVGTAQTLGSKTFVNGTLDAADVSFASTTGATVEALVIYIDTGVAGTSRLVAYLDTGYTGLPTAALSATTVNITWDAAGIFTI